MSHFGGELFGIPLNYLIYLFYSIYETDYLSSLGLNSTIFVCADTHDRSIFGYVSTLD